MVQTEIKHYWTLFSSFFKIGTFTIGGGYVMIPLIEKEVVERRRWIGREEFTEMLTLAQDLFPSTQLFLWGTRRKATAD